MSGYLPDTPNLGIPWCPGCEPDRDPSREILDTRWCEQHVSAREGSADKVAEIFRDPHAHLSGSAEAGGNHNRAINDLISGRKKEISEKIAEDPPFQPYIPPEGTNPDPYGICD